MGTRSGDRPQSQLSHDHDRGVTMAFDRSATAASQVLVFVRYADQSPTHQAQFFKFFEYVNGSVATFGGLQNRTHFIQHQSS
jgi:hypothetical protein